MFNRVKFVINKHLFQVSKNKRRFDKIKKYNKNNFNSFITISNRKFSSYSNKNPQNDPFNKMILLVTFFCGSFFIFKKR